MNNIICISSIDWDDTRERHQILMDRFSEDGHNVLFVETPGTRAIEISKGDFTRIWTRIKNIFTGIIRKQGGVTIFSPLTIPLNGRTIQHLNSFLFTYQVTLVKSYLKMPGFILWTYLPFPGISRFIHQLNPIMTIYDCVAKLSNNKKIHPGYIEGEKWLFKNADIVITDSQKIYSEIKLISKAGYLVQAGVEIDNYSSFEDHTYKERGKPIIGYIGSIHRWIDITLIEKIAIKFKEYDVQLIGPIKVDVSVFKKYDNVKLIGSIDSATIPESISNFNVGVIPYLQDSFTEYVFPTKLLEYLACGVPVVSTFLPEIQNFKDIIYIVDTHDQFIEAIERSIEKDSQSKHLHRKGVAKLNSWQSKYEQISKAIESCKVV